MACGEYRERLQESLDRRIDSTLAEDLTQHVAVCTNCANYWRDIQFVHSKLTDIPPVPLPMKLFQSLTAIPAQRSRLLSALFTVNAVSWRFIVAVLALITYGVGTAHLPLLQPYFDLSLLTLALSLSFSSLLRRRILGMDSERHRAGYDLLRP